MQLEEMEVKMTTQFTDYHSANIQVDGQQGERRLEFSFNNLDYIFVFNPLSDIIEDGAILTYVGDIERGRLAPSTFANPDAWVIANEQLAY